MESVIKPKKERTDRIQTLIIVVITVAKSIVTKESGENYDTHTLRESFIIKYERARAAN